MRSGVGPDEVRTGYRQHFRPFYTGIDNTFYTGIDNTKLGYRQHSSPHMDAGGIVFPTLESFHMKITNLNISHDNIFLTIILMRNPNPRAHLEGKRATHD